MIQILPKAFLFDFDGVICDSEKLHMWATLATIKSHQLSFTEEYYFQKLFGFDDRALFEHVFELSGKKLDASTLKKLMLEKNQTFMQMIENKIAYFPGVTGLIERLDKKKIPLGIVSGALSDEVEACLKKGGLDRHFKFTVCADDVNRSKPHPESYTLAYKKMLGFINNLTPEDCWVLEDSPTGIASAKAAGLSVIGITNTTSKENLSEANAVITHYDEIIC